MNINLVTQDDLLDFKTELLKEISNLLSSKPTLIGQPKWLKSYQVREMLGISPGTLQNLRSNGTMQFTKIGGLVFYLYEDVVTFMEGQKQNVSTNNFKKSKS